MSYYGTWTSSFTSFDLTSISAGENDFFIVRKIRWYLSKMFLRKDILEDYS